MQSDELRKLYSEIASIENKMETLQGDLKHLRAKLDLAVQKYEKNLKEEQTSDTALEPELTSPITESYEAIQEEKLEPQPIPKETKPTIIRPSLLQNNSTQKEEVTYKPRPVSQVKETYSRKESSPDFIDDLKSWFQSKVGNIPLEEFLGVNLLNKIGLLLLVVGFSFFLRLAYDWIGPFTKVIGMFVLSIGVYFGGDKIFRTKKYSTFGLGLIASSFALLYFTVYASYNIEATRIFPPDQRLIGFILLILTSSFVIGASLKYNEEILTSFAYFLGFLTISINENSDFNYFSMATGGLLAVSLIVIMTIRKWKYLTGVGIIATYANYWLYASGLPRTENGYLIKISETGHNYYVESILYLLFFWIIFFISTFTMKVVDKKTERVCSAINIVNAFSFFVMLGYVKPEPSEWGPFIVNMSLGTIYIIGAFAGKKYKRDFLWNSSLVLGITLITLAIPSKFSEYGHVFGWLLESIVLIGLGFVYREAYLKNLGYTVLVLNLVRFFTLPYGAVYIFESVNFPTLYFDFNRGMLYVLMILSFYGMILFSKKFYSAWSKLDKFAYNGFGLFATFTLVLFSIDLIQKPYQAFLLIPASGLLLYISLLSKNRNFYYSSFGLMIISLLLSIPLFFKSSPEINQIDQAISFSLVLVGSSIQYFLAKENVLLRRYSHILSVNIIDQRQVPFLKVLFFKGETFLWVSLFSILGLVLKDFSPYLHSIVLIGIVCLFFLVNYKYQQGLKQGSLLSGFIFLVGIYRYGLYREDVKLALSDKGLIAFTNLFPFWISGIFVLFNSNKIGITLEIKKILHPIIISATTFSAMLIGDIFIDPPYRLTYAAINSLLLVLAYKKEENLIFIYNSLLITFFTLFLGIADMVFSKKSPVGLYEYMNLVTYTITSFGTAGLIYIFTLDLFSRIFSYIQSILIGFCFILVVVPVEYRSIAFAILHLGHLFFLFRFQMQKYYDYAYLTLLISVLYFLNHTNFPSGSIQEDPTRVALIIGYSVLSILQTVFIFAKDTLSRNRIIYYILTISILFWSIYIVSEIHFSLFFFAIFVYISAFIIQKYHFPEVLHSYYYPLLLTMVYFLYMTLGNNSNVSGGMNVKDFTIGTFTLLLLLISVKNVETYKSKQTDFIPNKYSFENIVTLSLFLEFILLTMTVVDVRFWSLIWTLEAIVFIGYGVYRNKTLIRYAGIGLIGLAVLKIAFWDLQNLKENVRVLVLISIGGLFVIASFVYARFKDRLFSNSEDNKGLPQDNDPKN